jgi:dTMP kinase
MAKKKGKFIVIDGSDGSGKATQSALLMDRLTKEGHTVRMVDFPEYYKNFFGGFIGECLANKEYNFLHVHPKIASTLYAADRFESKEKIELWLKKGYVVVANRYVSANQIHQGGKIKDPSKRKEFLRWLDDMEHRVFGIPRPDIVTYLDLPVPVVRKLMAERNKNQTRAYLKNKKDVHEASLDFLKNSRNAALWLSDELPYFRKIECAPKGSIISREEIHEMVFKEVKKIVK